ncbi:MAG: hypothetical protein ACJ8EE_14465 [Bradyrhizobium sp.]
MAVLTDAAEYFGAVRDALRVAERHVQIIGWDIHSETSLVGPSGRADDGLPIALAPFLKALLRAKPELRIDILIWDFAALYAAEREWNSADKLISGTGGRVRFCLDSRLPLGSAQHQKIVVIDNAVGFVGGLDLTIRRWDTGDHLVDHACRRGPDGKSYSPFHDVQCMVDGEAAKALGELATARWISAGCHAEAFEPVHGEHWPASVPVDVRDMRAGIARTELGVRGRPGVREVARLFERSIKAANRFIYVENQFELSGYHADACTAHDRGALAAGFDRRAEDALVMAGDASHAGWQGRFHWSVGFGGRDGQDSNSLSIGERLTFVFGRDGSQQGHDR